MWLMWGMRTVISTQGRAKYYLHIVRTRMCCQQLRPKKWPHVFTLHLVSFININYCYVFMCRLFAVALQCNNLPHVLLTVRSCVHLCAFWSQNYYYIVKNSELYIHNCDSLIASTNVCLLYGVTLKFNKKKYIFHLQWRICSVFIIM